jgi:hypothetical protein
MIVRLTKYYSDDQITKNKMGGGEGGMWHVCGREECVQEFGGETRGGKNQLTGLAVDGMIILKWVFKK